MLEKLVSVQFNLWSFFLAFGLLQGILFALILLSYPRNSSNRYLIGMLLILILNLFNYLILSTGLFINFPHLLYIFTPSLYLLGPIYYCYTKSLIQPSFRPKKVWLHLLPFFMAMMLTLPFILMSGDEKVTIAMQQKGSGLIPLSIPTFLFVLGQILQAFLYIFFARKLLKGTVEGMLTRHLKKKVNWLGKFSLVFLIYWSVDFIALVIYLFFGLIHIEVFYLITLCSTIFINFLVFSAFKRSKELSEILLNKQSTKYKYSTLSKTATVQLLERIISYMKEEKPYLDHELSLGKIARHLEVSTNQISQVLNLEMGKSFYDFINEYRYWEARQRLVNSEYKHLTILAIAFDAGFNNKNTFNKVFKKHSGQTPSQYIKQKLLEDPT